MTDLPDNPLRDPRWMRVRKRPISREARFAEEDGSCQTLEGVVAYKRGDALVTGGRGEQWPVARDHFLETYAPVPPTMAGEEGRYVPRRQDVWAYQLRDRASIVANSNGDRLEGQSGDWVIRYADGSRAIVAAAIFAETYASAEGGMV